MTNQRNVRNIILGKALAVSTGLMLATSVIDIGTCSG